MKLGKCEFQEKRITTHLTMRIFISSNLEKNMVDGMILSLTRLHHIVVNISMKTLAYLFNCEVYCTRTDQFN